MTVILKKKKKKKKKKAAAKLQPTKDTQIKHKTKINHNPTKHTHARECLTTPQDKNAPGIGCRT